MLSNLIFLSVSPKETNSLFLFCVTTDAGQREGASNLTFNRLSFESSIFTIFKMIWTYLFSTMFLLAREEPFYHEIWFSTCTGFPFMKFSIVYLINEVLLTFPFTEKNNWSHQCRIKWMKWWSNWHQISTIYMKMGNEENNDYGNIMKSSLILPPPHHGLKNQLC